MLIHGEAGIGKTTLWDAARAVATERGFRVLSSRPVQSESGLPLGGFGDLFSGVSADVLNVLPGPQRRAIEVALLRTEPVRNQADQRALSVATTSLLAELASAHGPVLLAIDDVQWLDDSSAAILAFSLRRLGAVPLAVVLSLRGTTSGQAPLGVETAMAPDRFERLAVGPLPLAVLHRMFLASLGQSFPRLALIKIEQASRGNPFFALEIARALVRSGAFVAAGEPLPVPETLGALVDGRIGALPARTRAALLLVAAAVEPTLAVLERADSTSPRAALRVAVQDGIVVLGGDDVRFTHPLLASAILDRTEPARLRKVHTTLARTAGSEEARARHLGLAADGPDEATASALERAAGRAELRGAPGAAAELLELAGTLTPPRRARDARRRIFQAARCSFEAADMARAGELLQEQVRTISSGTERARALQLLGQISARSASFQDALAYARDALEAAGGEATLLAEIELDITFCSVSLGDFDGAEAHARAAVAHGEEVGAAGIQSAALAILSMVEFLSGRDVPVDQMRRALALEDRTRAGPIYTRARLIQGLILLFTGKLEEALDLLLEVRSEALERGLETDLPLVALYLVWAAVWLGDLDRAARFSDECRDVAMLNDDAITRAMSLTVGALVDAYRGSADRARQEGEEALALFLGSQWTLATIWPLWALGFLELSLGDAARVDSLLRPVADMVTSLGLGDPVLGVFLPDEIDALISLGEFERAGLYVGWFARRRSERRWVRAVVDRCRGALAAAEGDLASAIALLDRAEAEHGHLSMPFERARTLLVKGQIHRRRKEKRLADATLREALRMFEELGVPLWAARARSELGRVGLRPRATAVLTDTERLVAELAAGEMTNREVAEAAFLAPKTVDNVLSRVYRKLGIGSRAELGAWASRHR